MSNIWNIKCLFISSFVGNWSKFKILSFIFHLAAKICIHLTFWFIRTKQREIIHNENRNLKVGRVVINSNKLNIILFRRTKFMSVSDVDLLWVLIRLDYKWKLTKAWSCMTSRKKHIQILVFTWNVSNKHWWSLFIRHRELKLISDSLILWLVDVIWQFKSWIFCYWMLNQWRTLDHINNNIKMKSSITKLSCVSITEVNLFRRNMRALINIRGSSYFHR